MCIDVSRSRIDLNAAATTRGYIVKSLIRIAVLAALGIGVATSASAATVLSFGVTGVGSYTVDTVDISLATTTKSIPVIEVVSGTTTPATFALAGLANGLPVLFSTLTFSTVNGADVFTLTAGLLTFSFTTVSNVQLVATTATAQGSISEQFNGTVTGDLSLGSTFLGQTVSISETCTQTNLGASITCSESVLTNGPLNLTPEPASLALIGI